MPSSVPYPRSDGGAGQACVAATVANGKIHDTNTLGYARALLCSVDMTLKIQDCSGNISTGVPFQKGYNPISLVQIFSTGSSLNGGVIFVIE